MSEGYLFCVGGDILYYKLLHRAIITLRKFDPVRPICVVTDNMEAAKVFSNFENIIYKPFRLDNHLVDTVTPNLPWHRFGFYPKVFQFMYSPFDKTMFFDVDYVFLTDFTYFWDRFNESSCLIMVAGQADENNCSPPDWQWGWIFSMIQKSGICIPQTNSSFMIYRKGFVRYFIQHIEKVLLNLPTWNCKPQFCGGYPDEIVISLLLGILNIHPNQEMFDWMINPSKVLCCDKNV